MYEYSPDQMREYSGCSLPVDVIVIANLLGYTVKYADLDSADAYISCVGKKFIVVKRDISENRKRFSIAHEIGHLMCGHDFNQINCKNIGFSLISKGKDEFEREADEYAALLLIPEKEIQDDIKREFCLKNAINNAQQKYCVSLECYMVRFVKRVDFPLCVIKLQPYKILWSMWSSSWPEEIDLERVHEIADGKRTHVREWLLEQEDYDDYHVIFEKTKIWDNQSLAVLYTAL